MCAQRWNSQGLSCRLLWLSVVAFLSLTSQLFPQLYNQLGLIPGKKSNFRFTEWTLANTVCFSQKPNRSWSSNPLAISLHCFLQNHSLLKLERALRSCWLIEFWILTFELHWQKTFRNCGAYIVLAIFILLRILRYFSTYQSQSFLKERTFNIPL